VCQPLVTEQVPEPENKENEWSMQYRKRDFALPVLVPVLEMGLPFPVLVNCSFGNLKIHKKYTKINKSPFSVSANVFSFAHRLMCPCFV
jgi:hypothetical protein